MRRRDFLEALLLAAAAVASLRPDAAEAQAGEALYDPPPFGNVSLLHITDVHAQLLPVYYREPSVNLGDARAPHLVGEHLLRHFRLERGSAAAYAFSHLDFEALARRFGKLGGYAHLATLVKRLRASRPHALLLDGGDTWQGSATSLWTKGADMIGAQKLLGVDLMTAHWEFTYGSKRVRRAVDGELAPMEFLAQNVKTADFEDPVFKPYSLRSVNGVALAVIGQAFPYTPIANPRHLVPEWTFGIQETRLQQLVDEVRAKGAQAVVLLSH
ncbi:MAG: thiosulfohydrolase SoxB, partial [Burkholderiales bacterium]